MPKVTINNNQGLVQAAGRGLNINSPLILGTQAVTAAADPGTAIDANGGPLVLADTGNSAHIVSLPALADVEDGYTLIIANVNASTTLEVAPATDDSISGIGDNADVTVAARGVLVVHKNAGSVFWTAYEPALPGA